MKKTVLVLLLLTVVFTGTAFAEADFTSYSPSFTEGDMAIQVGLSLFNFFFTGDTLLPPLSASFDYAVPIADFPLSFGGFLGVAATRWEFFTYNYGYTYLMAGGRAAYHIDLGVEKLDAYTGVLLGLNLWLYSSNDPFVSNFSDAYLIWGGFVGGRYFLTDAIALFGELGYGLGIVTVGATLKL